MYVLAFFYDIGTPATGLSPTIRIRDVSDNSLVITDAAMSEVGDGAYKYDFTTYDSDKDYSIRCDGSSALTIGDRYLFGGNYSANLERDLEFLKAIEGGRWHLVGNQMIFYKADNTTEVARFNVFDNVGNPSMINVFQRVRV